MMPHEQAASVLVSIESTIYELLTRKAEHAPPRWKRWLAMYYPDARIQRLFRRLTHVEMGEGSFANPGVIVVDDYTSGECLLPIQQHPAIKDRLVQRAKIVVEDDVWIGAHVTVLPGIRISRGAIIGPGSVVNRDVSLFTIVAGVPARALRQIEPLSDA
jgi:hypothetical protein